MIQETVTLRPELHELLVRSAEDTTRSLDDLINEAIEAYFEARQDEILDREAAAYKDLHPELWRTMPGEWVAIHEQHLVDHDTDQMALYRRVRRTYGSTPVLIRRVGERPTEEIWVRTPSTGRLLYEEAPPDE